MKFFIKRFFSECDQTADLVTFTEETLNGDLNFLCSVQFMSFDSYSWLEHVGFYSVCNGFGLENSVCMCKWAMGANTQFVSFLPLLVLTGPESSIAGKYLKSEKN